MERKYTDLLKVGQGERKIHTVNCNIYSRRVVLSLGDNQIKCIILTGIPQRCLQSGISILPQIPKRHLMTGVFTVYLMLTNDRKLSQDVIETLWIFSNVEMVEPY